MRVGAPWRRSRALFVRGLGLVYLCAFVSLGVQIPGLIGEHGVLPAARQLAALHAYPDAGPLWPVPTLLWFDGGDLALHAAWIAGAGTAALAMAGVVPALALAAAWALYLSLVGAGQEFLRFQWDHLLLEAGFLGIFVAPWTLRLGAGDATRPSRCMRLLCWWLAFRLFFFSGFVKLASGDETWWGLTALGYHWWTQPLPTFTSWWAARLPPSAERFCVAATLAIELGLPWWIWLGRIPRSLAFAGFVALMLVISATGNYGFFNLLAVVICLPLLDDDTWQRLRRTGAVRDEPSDAAPAAPTLQRAVIALAASVVGVASVPVALAQAGLVSDLPGPLAAVCDVAGRYSIVNHYGLFARMTTTRREIVIEGSRDGKRWEPYRFRWKPGPPEARPAFTGPHMPRLDWQMWFAALGPPERSPWLWSLMRHLLLGTGPVLDLLATNPFPDAPPLAVRALLYDYRFTDAAEHAATGAWWKRSPVGEFIPEMRLATQGGELRP